MIGSGPLGAVPLGAAPDPSLSPLIATLPIGGVASGAFTIRASSVPFRTGAADSPARAAFDGGMTEADPFNFRWQASGSDWAIVSGFGSGEGALRLSNADGRHDILTGPYAVDGRPHEIRMGAAPRRDGTLPVPFRDWFRVFAGTARGYHVDRDALTVRLTDWAATLDQPLQAATFLGTGGLEGGADLKGKRRPRAFGYVENCRPVLLDAATRLYMVNDGPVQAIALSVNGLELTGDGDYPDLAALQAAAITAGRYATCLALGLARLEFEIGNTLVTARVEGDSVGGFAATIPAIVRRMAEGRLDAARLYEPGFAAYAAGGAYEAGFWADQDGTATVREAIAAMLPPGSFAFFTRLGKLSLARLEVTAGPPAIRLTDADIVDVRREEFSDAVPPREIRVSYGRNWTAMAGQIAEDVSDARRAWLTEQHRFATATDAAIAAAHPTARSRDAMTMLRSQAGAQAVADQLMALRRRPVSLWRVRTRFAGFRAEQGWPVHIQSDRVRWLARGRQGAIVDRAINARERSSELLVASF